ncbi:tail protein X [Burkholderia stagnalis]|uniref:tail protein X n=1 Tax=Burkholderia stagnalis TaxID=1503054 RepID=UPI000F5712A6|nr:tail protein X [Burkholderia stagnalis]RQQ37055.1 phage tail protein [Burkholderia stagnalis]RQQ55658.1 phage tail protein [Burkholderia stagnalis]RQY19119.1 phage tail protein [Burkholderia stagnalis]RQY64196.1 phage tail protein [Burkholderia stagnalis]RQY70383.1 phage tail protein [Burkholderia stagnalis]
MTQTYLSRDGDTLDYIAYAQYGKVSPEILAAILAANFGLADLGPLLPIGTPVSLPVIDVATQTATSNEVSLWT